jgi:hypothetical protein
MAIKTPRTPRQEIVTPDVSQPSIIDSRALVAEAVQDVGRIASGMGAVEAQVGAIDEKNRLKLVAKLEKEQEAQDRADATDAVTISKGSLNEHVQSLKILEQRKANGATVNYDTFSNKLVTETVEQLQTDRAKDLYLEDMGLVNINNRDSVMTHERTETIKGQKAAFSASADVSVQTGIESFDNPNVHAVEEDNIEIQADSLREVSGWSKDERDVWEAEKKSKMYEGVVRQWAITDPETARLSFETNKDKIDATRHDELDALVSKNQTNQKGKELSESIALQTDDFEEQKNLAKAHKDADVSDNALARIRANQTDKLAKDKRSKEAARDNMFGNIHKMSRGEGTTLTQMLELANSTPNDKDNADYDKYARAKFEDINGVAREGDVNKYLTLLDDIEAGKYSKASELESFYADLSLPQFNKAIGNLESKLQEDKTGVKKAEGDIKYSTAKDAFSVALGVKYDVEDEDQNQQFMFAYDKLIEAGITDHHEATKFVQNLLIDGSVRGRLWDSTLSRPEAESEGKLNQWLPELLDIKDDNGDERRSIDTAFRSRGIRTKNETLMRLFKKDAILNLKLSEAEKAEYRRLISQEGVVHPVRR